MSIVNTHKLVTNLVECVEQMMPGVPYISVDIGLLNDTLIDSKQWLRENDDAEVYGDAVSTD